MALPGNNAADKEGKGRCKSDVAAWEKQEKKMEGEVVHIAVGKNARKEEPNIRWAAAAFPEAAIVLVHVHWPSEWMPFSKIYLLCLFSSLGSCSCCSLS